MIIHKNSDKNKKFLIKSLNNVKASYKIKPLKKVKLDYKMILKLIRDTAPRVQERVKYEYGGIFITEKELLQYRKIKKEIADLEKRKGHQETKDIDVVCGKVKSSMAGFPYIETHVPVQMYDPQQVCEADKMVKMYTEEIIKLNIELNRLEEFIEEIPDSEIRQIFRYRFVDGLKQREIAKEINLDRSRISRKISDYLKKRTQSTNII